MTGKMNDLSFLIDHQSIPAKNLLPPAPSADELEWILQAAMSAPDHGEMRPFRFLVIEGDARHQLAKVFESAVRNREPDADQATIDKQKNKPLRSPMIIVVIAQINQNPKIPEIEQLLCAGCAAQHIQLACTELGYGSIWLTGANAYDLTVHQALGLDMNEKVIGFMYVGTAAEIPARKSRHSASQVTTRWHQPHHNEFAI